MSFLTPLYALGLLAIAAPIVLHLIRRAPRGDVPFSSLMFLAPAPPRLTRRNRLEHLLLLLLRATALALLAIAFTRPFLRQAARLDFGNSDQRRIAILIDTSASMRRGNLWPRAKAMANKEISNGRPNDQLAVFAFDVTTTPLLSFDESATLDPSRRQAVAGARLEQLELTWGATHLDQALIDTVAAIEDVADASEKTGRMPRRVVLISDLQQGSRLDALGDFEWPADVELDPKLLTDDRPNAGLQGLADPVENEPAGADAPLRVRVANDPGSRTEQFELVWVDHQGTATGPPIPVYVPPGESRVVRVPRPPAPSLRQVLRLKGDAHEFDNTLFLADEAWEEKVVLYVGPDGPEDYDGLLYYLQRVFSDSFRRRIRVLPMAPAATLAWEPELSPPLIIVAAETSPENRRRLRTYLDAGGTLLFVLTASGRSETLAALTDAEAWEIAEAAVNRDVLWSEIAFDHPLFAPLAVAPFNDFTKIHFWKYRRLGDFPMKDARVLVRFENGDPAIVEKAVGKGKLVVFASGWHPADSQLARSSKFVPLMSALVEGPAARPFEGSNYRVGDRVSLPVWNIESQGLTVHKPGGEVVTISPRAGVFAETDQPGVYTIDTPTGARSFAVNLDPGESKTSPLHDTTLEQFGCRLANPSRKAIDRERQRQLHNAELENRQKLWRWLILAALLILIFETWLAGRWKHPRAALAKVPSP
jgi:hypothetical protein